MNGGTGGAGTSPIPKSIAEVFEDNAEKADIELVALRDKASDAEDEYKHGEDLGREKIQLEGDNVHPKWSAERVNAKVRELRYSEPVRALYLAYRAARTERNLKEAEVKKWDRRMKNAVNDYWAGRRAK